MILFIINPFLLYKYIRYIIYLEHIFIATDLLVFNSYPFITFAYEPLLYYRYIYY